MKRKKLENEIRKAAEYASDHVLDRVIIEVKMLSNIAGPYGSAQAGDKKKFTLRQVQELLEAGAIEIIEDPKCIDTSALENFAPELNEVEDEGEGFGDLFTVTQSETAENQPEPGAPDPVANQEPPPAPETAVSETAPEAEKPADEKAVPSLNELLSQPLGGEEKPAAAEDAPKAKKEKAGK